VPTSTPHPAAVGPQARDAALVVRAAGLTRGPIGGFVVDGGATWNGQIGVASGVVDPSRSRQDQPDQSGQPGQFGQLDQKCLPDRSVAAGAR
jgi:hypothetical protein